MYSVFFAGMGKEYSAFSAGYGVLFTVYCCRVWGNVYSVQYIWYCGYCIVYNIWMYFLFCLLYSIYGSVYSV